MWQSLNETLSCFCSSTFWDDSLTWKSPDPEFTVCFERTVLAWIPCAFLWTFAPLELYFLRRGNTRYIRFNFYNIFKLMMIVVLGTKSLFDIISLIFNKDAKFVIDFYTSAMRFCTWCLFFGLTYMNIRCGIRSSGVLFVFSLLLTLCGAPQFRRELKETIFGLNGTNHTITNFIFYSLYYVCILSVFLLNCFADGQSVVRSQSIKRNTVLNDPENDASFLSIIFYFWFDKIAWRAYKDALTTENLWDLREDMRMDAINRRFVKSRRDIADRCQKSTSRREIPSGVRDENRQLLKPKRNFDAENTKKTSILPHLIKVFGPTFAVAVILKSIHSALLFASPQILKSILTFVGAESEFLWRGYFYAVLLLAVSILQALFINYEGYMLNSVGLQIRTAMISIIYEKTLRISNGGRKEFTHGEIVNLMAVDAQRFARNLLMLPLVWVCPFEIFLSIYFLWNILGYSVLAGISVLVVLTIVSSKIISRIRTLQLKQMKLKDQRIKATNEILSGIKILKLYAFEENFERLVAKIREKEIGILKKTAYLYAGTSFAWLSTPFLVSFLTFGVYVLSNEENVLNAQVAFVSMSLFNIMKSPMKMLPYTLISITQLSTAIKRIDDFLNSEELDENAVTHEPVAEPIVIENGDFSWENYDEPPILKNINVKMRPGSLVAVVGPVGSGKSSLLSAILGEMYKQSGYVNTTGRIAYVPQEAWIRNATFIDNITFGVEEANKKSPLYETVLEACALIPDLAILPGGDQTEIGEKGINLSGGQKQRLSLARAVYSEADVYLLDDPLSAVDAHVGKHIFEKVIGPNGLLNQKSRIWITNNVNYLSYVDEIIVLDKGSIVESGTYTELLKNGKDFASFLNSYAKQITEEEDTNVAQTLEMNHEKKIDQFCVADSKLNTTNGEKKPGNGGHKLIKTEEARSGNVKWSVCSYYLKASGSFTIAVIVLTNLLQQVFSIASNYWLSAWSSDAGTARNASSESVVARQYVYLGVYALLGVAEAASIMAQTMTIYMGALKAAKYIHDRLLSSMLHWPVGTFDRIPSGRIINRFGSDVDTLDNLLPSSVQQFLACVAIVMSILFVISFNTPAFLCVLLPLGVIYYFIQRVNAAVSKQVVRMASVSKSPIYSHFGDTIIGVQSIRAYNMKTEFIKVSQEKVDLSQKCSYARVIAVRWFSMRILSLGAVVIFATTLFAILRRDALSSALVGLSVLYALEVTNNVFGLVREASEVETSVVAVERIKEYTEVAKEAPWVNPSVDDSIPKNWPSVGQIVFQNFRMRYQADLEPVLKGLSFKVEGGEKVGIVGRTGSGKSSLTMSLFRLIESTEGEIFVDDVDVSKIGLHTLRSRLTIIPQDPVLFSGTLRMNLDPTEKFTDESLWECLESVNLKKYVSGLSAGLQHEITESGNNFSVGQRQLVCLARALLRKTKILVMDEATAAIDLETDDLIQTTIRKEFQSSTVLTIAHRLNTVLDYDRIMVLDDGNVAEFDTPSTLLALKTSIFYKMAVDAGLV